MRMSCGAFLERAGDLLGRRVRLGQLEAHPGEDARSPIDALSESTTWISRSGSMSRAIWALLIVPDSVFATWTETIASAPSAKAAS